MLPATGNRLWLAGAGLLLAALATGCENTGAPVDRDVEKRESFKRDPGPEKEWQESQFELPAYPGGDGLIEVEIAGPASFTFFIDPESIRVYEDEVVRYTLVARSSSGTDNVTFEGLRCKTGEYKSYALGSVDGTWVAARNADWTSVPNLSRNNARHALYRYYVCSYGVPQRDASRVVAALKRGIPEPEGR